MSVFLPILLHSKTLNSLRFVYIVSNAVFLRCFRDLNRVLRIENWVPRNKENYHRVPRIREIGSLQIYTGNLIFSLKKYQCITFCKVQFIAMDRQVVLPIWSFCNYAESKTKSKKEELRIIDAKIEVSWINIYLGGRMKRKSQMKLTVRFVLTNIWTVKVDKIVDDGQKNVSRFEVAFYD